MTSKQRVAVTIDTELVAAARRAVQEGRAESVSAWVGDAMQTKFELEERLAAMDEFIKEYEAEHGVITDDDMEESWRVLRAKAIVVRGRHSA